MAATLTIKVQQNGNNATVTVANKVIDYEVEGLVLPELTNHAFAVWHVLPAAMTSGAVIEVDGPVDPGTRRAAQKFSETWELWRPGQFKRVQVEAQRNAPPASPGRRRDLAMYSGGLDSSHMLLRLGRRPQRACALTVQGLDYGVDAGKSFNSLKKKIEPFLEHLNYDQVVVRTNATAITASGRHSYALRLMGAASILSGVFEEGHFAADCTHAQDMLTFPFGLNHITNKYFETDDIVLRPLEEDVTRSEKVALVATEPIALNAISFCPDRSVAPYNCGQCEKCVRTKMMFMVETGAIPPIFVDTSFNAHTLDTLKLDDSKVALFLLRHISGRALRVFWTGCLDSKRDLLVNLPQDQKRKD
ncbi:hypothetical protein [Devosia aurantiaca]|uniref:Uncharacterized protein n=1 Tax=Devosia aurantiaca TaxID=2714858 RepID=A0A6M1STI8_9HYPH|nr:hypothetical protein [Devosia aurantiaca]NGP18515.1 hypothetical protein [Devosia aurantiaca]